MYPLLLKMVIADASLSEMYEIAQDISSIINGDVYTLDSRKASGAAFDLVTVLTSGAAVATILGLFIQILSIRDSDRKIIIYVHSGEPIEIKIDKDSKFIEVINYQKELNKIFKENELSEFDRNLLEEIQYSDRWIKISKRVHKK